MQNKKDSPGVFIPPPLIYAAVFLLSFIVQGYFTIRRGFFFHSPAANIIGLLFIATGLVFAIPALRQFFKTKNTIVLIKPATSLQNSGVYSISRNPMYLGLMFQYLGLALIFGNWWTIFLLPVLFFLIQNFVILPEEKYLLRAFGESYTDYKKKVRRWI
jgi:protein-S-isoprenylcysteine O-methyltransferase Ste14